MKLKKQCPECSIIIEAYQNSCLNLLKDHDLNENVNVRIIDIRPPKTGEYYISSLGTYKYCFQGAGKNKRMTRLIVEKI